ncbi:putative RNA polymerase II subunit B1 CTD phosphatase RPAP2 [Trichinella pseudospiralis]|uniref:RNA polymerase II subunit B1 CTD phosphatase RPAP2 homolog n=1 Tax=Trichinella pseudospiralis TaxID=6337 RepID=A0A0V1FE99_TRIPS|nr:putative RNA polymerase II subunit B1 CTD phosphatase RPAP2 [Trichinella pseudospiralis]
MKEEAERLRQQIILNATESMLEVEISREMLTTLCALFDEESFRNASEERYLSGLCAYGLCRNFVSTNRRFPKYSLRNNRIFENTERIWFCSDSCYTCYQLVIEQLPVEPFWLRKGNDFSIVELPDPSSLKNTIPGKEIIFDDLDLIRQMREISLDDKNDAPNKPDSKPVSAEHDQRVKCDDVENVHALSSADCHDKCLIDSESLSKDSTQSSTSFTLESNVSVSGAAVTVTDRLDCSMEKVSSLPQQVAVCDVAIKTKLDDHELICKGKSPLPTDLIPNDLKDSESTSSSKQTMLKEDALNNIRNKHFIKTKCGFQLKKLPLSLIDPLPLPTQTPFSASNLSVMERKDHCWNLATGCILQWFEGVALLTNFRLENSSSPDDSQSENACQSEQEPVEMQDNESKKFVYLPLVDAVNQDEHRIAIASYWLLKPLRKLLNAFSIDEHKLFERKMKLLIRNIKLTAKNISLQPFEWKFASLVLFSVLRRTCDDLPAVRLSKDAELKIVSRLLQQLDCKPALFEDLVMKICKLLVFKILLVQN